MKLAAKLLLFISLAATLAFAQSQYVKNVIVVIQENRTPDNLFQALCNAQGTNCAYNSSTQFDIQSYGYCKGYSQQVPLQPVDLYTPNCNLDPSHLHVDWTNIYDNGNMDGACQPFPASCQPIQCNVNGALDCSRYAYVDNSTSTIQPYLDVATQYGWANYMYQTNQGPSFPAHQFLLSGTSAPVDEAPPISPDYTYFAMDNTFNCGQQGCANNENAGCAAPGSELERLISPLGDTSTEIYPCFEHRTLVDLLDAAQVSWRYYSGIDNGIWTAPNAINHLCNNTTQNGGGSCGSNNQGNQDWNNYVAPYLEGITRGNATTLAPFLYDMQNCNFTNWSQNGGVIFVVPDGRWSDHPANSWGMGPDWVANIVNLVGRSSAQGGCSDPQPNWNNTVILITWDDWGGWYDHLSPTDPNHGPGIGYKNGNGNGVQYVYGLRVPLLVVSAYVKSDSQWGSGHISTFTHDFGSILAFIEKTYGLNNIYPTYAYADYFAPDKSNPLGDFFCYPTTCQERSFTPINLQYSSSCQAGSDQHNPHACKATNCNQQGACLCSASCFINYPGGARDADTN